ncbi:hypothetical protein [Natrinema sp. CGMCC1.2065]|uniref:hypothetical protein n=1 Tax=Natrinema sp. CGMCC1.2065 TaxID=3445767 RepID=UPI003F4A47B2
MIASREQSVLRSGDEKSPSGPHRLLENVKNDDVEVRVYEHKKPNDRRIEGVSMDEVGALEPQPAVSYTSECHDETIAPP